MRASEGGASQRAFEEEGFYLLERGGTAPSSSRKIGARSEEVAEKKKERTANGSEPRIIPSGNMSLLNEPLELALGEEGVNESKASIIASVVSSIPRSLVPPQKTHPKSQTSTVLNPNLVNIHWY